MATSPRVQRAAMAAAQSPRNLSKKPSLQNIAIANATAKRLQSQGSGRDLLASEGRLKPRATPRSGTAKAVKMLRKYVKKFGHLPEKPDHLVAFADAYGGVRFVDARAAMRITGISTLSAGADEEEEAAATAAAEREAAEAEAQAQAEAELEAEAQNQAAAELEAEMDAPPAAASAAAATTTPAKSPTLQRKGSEATMKKVALKRWLARHGFGAADGLEVLDAVDIREIADFEFVEVRDLVDGGMASAVAERLLAVFAEHGEHAPLSPRRDPAAAVDDAEGFKSPRMLQPASRSRKPEVEKVPAADDDHVDGGADAQGVEDDDTAGAHVDQFVDDFDDDDDDDEADARRGSTAAGHEADEVAALPSISSPAVRKAVSNSARRQARWQTRVEAFLHEHDPDLLQQAGYVDDLLAKYRGREVAALRFLRDKYAPKPPAAAAAAAAAAPALPAAAQSTPEKKQPKRMPSARELNNASFRTEATMSVGSPDSRGSFESGSFGSEGWGSDSDDDDDDGAVDEMILKQFMERLKSTLSSDYGQHVLRIEAAVNNAKYDNDLNRITVRRSKAGDSLGCMVSTNRVAWRNHVFLEVTQVRYIDEERRVPGPAMAAGLRVGDIIVSILGDQLVNSLDHFKELCREKTRIEMTIVRPAKADLSYISREELEAVQKVIEARVQTQQRDILHESKKKPSSSNGGGGRGGQGGGGQGGGGGSGGAPSRHHHDLSPATRHRKQNFAYNNQPRARAAPPAARAGSRSAAAAAAADDKAMSPVSPKRVKPQRMSFSRVGLPPLTACRPFEPVDERRGLVWFRMERSGNGKKFSLIDTKVEAALLVAEQKKVLAFDYEVRYGLGMRQLCLDEGGIDPALGVVKMADVSKLRYVCFDVRKDASRPQPSGEELCFVRYKIINDRKFVTLVIPKSANHNSSFRRTSGPHVARKHDGALDLHEALRTHHKEMILTFENEPPEYDQSLGHHVAPTTAPRKVSEAFVASVKNFVLWSTDGPVMEFWRTGKNTYALAVGHPLTLVQAFTTAISSVTAPS